MPLTLAINDPANQLVNAAEVNNVPFTVSGLALNETATVIFTDVDNNQVSVNVNADGSYSANLSTLDDGTITSSLVETGQGDHTTPVAGTSITLDTDRGLTPTMTVNAANPANVTFAVGGLEGDEHGTVTFTDTNDQQDVVPIVSNGTYSANLSNLADGTLKYLLSVTDPAGNVTTLDPTAMLGDGSANAPAGVPELPNLFAGEAVRPPWMVAGVDYAVGIPAGTVLTDWQNLKGPGISIVGNIVRIDNTNDVQINNVDFSLHGGAMLYINNSNNTVVTDCNFQATTSSDVIQLAGSSTGLTVKYSVIDGDGGAFDGSGLIGATGNVVIQYNSLKNFPERALETGGNATIDLRYNLIENGAMYPGAHLNFLQFVGAGTVSSLVEFNTTYQQVQVASGEGFQFYIWDPSGAQGTQVSPTFAYNTMIASPTQGRSYVPGGNNMAMSYLLHGTSGAQFPTAITGTASIHDNYFDASGAYGVFYPNTFNGWSLYNNYNMATGTLLPGTTGSTPAAPTITAFSPDTGVAGDGITNANVLTITGTAAAISTVTLYDGTVLLGTATANTSGAWSLVTCGAGEPGRTASPRPTRCRVRPAPLPLRSR